MVRCCECAKCDWHVETVQVQAAIRDSIEEDIDDISSNEQCEKQVEDLEIQKTQSNLVSQISSVRASLQLSLGHLSLDLQDFSLLRGTRLVQVLRRFGSELRANSLKDTFTQEEAERLFGRSAQVQKIDHFISHCWQDERFAKVVALHIHCNLRPAVLSSLFLAMLAVSLTRLKFLPVVEAGVSNEIPHFPWGLCVGMSSFFMILFSWQYLQDLWSTKVYFLDKFCVHQGDSLLKQQGVRSFAAFVAQSDHMLLLWSPQYFTRLWCTLELAALVKSKSPSSLPLKIFPLQLAKMSLYTWSMGFMVYATNQFNRIAGRPIPDILILALALIIGGYLLCMAFRRYALDRKAMNQQIQSFSVEDAKCSDPSDRQWVETSMLRWFADLQLCNQHIREGLREQIRHVLGPEDHFPTTLAFPILLINLYNDGDYFAGGYFDGSPRRIFAAVGFTAFLFTFIPLLYKVCFCFSERRSWIVEFLINASLSLGATIITACVYVVTHNIVANPEVSAWALSIVVLEILMALWLQRASWRRR
ncbi:unnamed protein product [Durusdinium trenchii]|uniref:E3 ubiquitin-protein ligase ZNRF3 n=2 Tax=Durusdinium trenchii TaxID=1381693 RepID=A0ABP0Q3R1_9DINO